MLQQPRCSASKEQPAGISSWKQNSDNNNNDEEVGSQYLSETGIKTRSEKKKKAGGITTCTHISSYFEIV